ncbi:MAG: hypothetical protein QOC68_1714 [Solirubrobacteraceae bacterium]|jgi:hypothetical protein|nr:hypothetical protein [Solirubrobacteraceae bacterium]
MDSASEADVHPMNPAGDWTSGRVRGFILGAVAAGGVLFLAGTLVSAQREGGHSTASSALAQLNLLRENNLATWWSSMVLLLIALLCAAAWRADRRPAQEGGPVLRLGWLFLGGVFALLSLDEVGSLHERLADDPALAFGTPSADWVALLALPIAGVALLMVAFSLANLRRRPLPFALLILSVALFATVPLQEKLELSEKFAGQGRPVVEALLEEGSELTAGWLALCGLLLYLARAPGSAGARLPRAAIAGGALGLLVGMGICLLVVPAPTDESFGYASAWFPAAIGALVAPAAAHAARGVQWRYAALAVGALLASAFFASEARLWVDEQGATHPVVRWAVPAVVLLAVAVGSALTVRRLGAWWSVLALAAGNVLLAVALARGGTGSHLVDGIAMAALVLAAASPAEVRSARPLGADLRLSSARWSDWRSGGSSRRTRYGRSRTGRSSSCSSAA